MNAFELLEAMGGIDEKYLAETYDRRQGRMRVIRSLTAAAASVVLITGIGIGAALTGWRTGNAAESADAFEYSGMTETNAAAVTESVCEPENGNTADLPILSFSGFAGDYGMEALMAKDISEIIGSNPWTKDCTLTSLPVYRNLSFSNQRGGSASPYSSEELFRIAEEISGKLGTEILSHLFNYMMVDKNGEYSEQITSLTAETEFCSISVTAGGMVSLRIDDGGLGKVSDSASALAVYEKFAGLLGFDEPTADMIASYNIYGEAEYEVHIWDSSGEEREQILGYAFDKVLVASTDSWYGIHLDSQYTRRELIGEYPIISWEDAAAMLLDGYYISTVPDETFGKPESYEHVELVYRTQDGTILPYYKFRVHLVEWDDKHFDGEKHFGAYYVPAVERGYLDESSFWDGTFN